jgi:hypothetical protein
VAEAIAVLSSWLAETEDFAAPDELGQSTVSENRQAGTNSESDVRLEHLFVKTLMSEAP